MRKQWERKKRTQVVVLLKEEGGTTFSQKGGIYSEGEDR